MGTSGPAMRGELAEDERQTHASRFRSNLELAGGALH